MVNSVLVEGAANTVRRSMTKSRDEPTVGWVKGVGAQGGKGDFEERRPMAWVGRGNNVPGGVVGSKCAGRVMANCTLRFRRCG